MKRLLAVVAASVLLLCPLAHGEVISVNFSGVQEDPLVLQNMDPEDATGVEYVSNWNNVDQITPAGTSSFVNGSGVGVGTSVAFNWEVTSYGDTYAESYAPGNAVSGLGSPANALERFWRAHIGNINGIVAPGEADLQIIVSGVPATYTTYDVYVYYMSAAETFDIGIGTDTRTVLAANGSTAFVSYVDSGTPSSYAVWSGLTADSFTITLGNAQNDIAPVAGFQIVEFIVPEPVTLSLLATGVGAIVLRRRRR